MMKSVLKTLAISFGGGLALGAGMRLAQGPAKGRPEPRADLDPLLARLKNVESRIVEMESTERVAPVASAPAPSAFAERTLAAFESTTEQTSSSKPALAHWSRSVLESSSGIATSRCAT